jgi:hypothetical protein
MYIHTYIYIHICIFTCNRSFDYIIIGMYTSLRMHFIHVLYVGGDQLTADLSLIHRGPNVDEGEYMYIYIYIYIYICMYIYMDINIYIYTYIYIHIYIYIYIYIYTYIYMYK